MEYVLLPFRIINPFAWTREPRHDFSNYLEDLQRLRNSVPAEKLTNFDEVYKQIKDKMANVKNKSLYGYTVIKGGICSDTLVLIKPFAMWIAACSVFVTRDNMLVYGLHVAAVIELLFRYYDIWSVLDNNLFEIIRLSAEIPLLVQKH